MKHTAKRFAALLAALVLALCLSIPAFAAAPLVRDEMGLFDADTYSQLEASAEAASDGHDCDVYFLVVDSIGDTDQRQYAKDYYLANGLGSGSEQSGILFLLAVGSRKYVTITYGGGVTAFTDYRIEQIEDAVVPYLSDDDWAEAASEYLSMCADTLDFYAEHGEPLDVDNDTSGLAHPAPHRHRRAHDHCRYRLRRAVQPDENSPAQDRGQRLHRRRLKAAGASGQLHPHRPCAGLRPAPRGEQQLRRLLRGQRRLWRLLRRLVLSALFSSNKPPVLPVVFACFYFRITCKRKETQRMSKKITALIPGAALALGIACIAKWLETLESSAGLHLIGASVIALFIGMAINAFFQPNKTTAPGIKFTSKKVLKFAIVLLGASLNIRTVLTVGRFSLTVMLFTLATCFGLGALIGKALGLNWKTSSLINAGTGICGGSAIAAIAPVIEADDMDIAYGMSATFLFDTVMIVVFPLLGRWLGLSDAAFGLWAGTAVNDTSSVVATGYAFSEAAGDFATMVKLTRTLAIIPAVLVFAAINLHLKKKESAQANGVKVSIRSIFPWFILAFLAMSLLTSLGLLPAGLVSGLKTISKFLMVAALAAIGLNTNFKSLCRSGAKPMLHGFIISTLVVLVAIGVEYMIGIAPYGTL